MKATLLNPEDNPRRRRRRAKRRYVRRRNAESNPRRRRRPSRRRYNRELNPRRRRRGGVRRRNPSSNPEFNFSRIGYATAGGVAVRFAMRKIGGKRVVEDGKRKLDTMHLVSALGSIYFARDIANAIGAVGDEGIAFEGGMAGVAGNMLVDQHLSTFSSEYLMPFDSPAPTGADMAGVRGGAGVRGIGANAGRNPPADVYAEYSRLAGLGQLPPGGVYVRGADGSVWWFPSSRSRGAPGMMGAGRNLAGGMGARELPDHIRVGATVRDDQTGERFMVGSNRGQRVLIPIGSRPAMGATAGDYLNLVSR